MTEYKVHWVVATFHRDISLKTPEEIIALVTSSFFSYDFSGALNELNKYPVVYYEKNYDDNNLYTELWKSNVLWNWQWHAYVVTQSLKYTTTYVIYYNTSTLLWELYSTTSWWWWISIDV